MVFELCERIDKQKDRHTYDNTLCPPGDKVTTTVMIGQLTHLGHLLLAPLLEVVCVRVVVGLNDDEVAGLGVNDKPTRSKLQRSSYLVEHSSELLQSQDPIQL